MCFTCGLLTHLPRHVGTRTLHWDTLCCQTLWLVCARWLASRVIRLTTPFEQHQLAAYTSPVSMNSWLWSVQGTAVWKEYTATKEHSSASVRPSQIFSVAAKAKSALFPLLVPSLPQLVHHSLLPHICPTIHSQQLCARLSLPSPVFNNCQVNFYMGSAPTPNQTAVSRKRRAAILDSDSDSN